MQNTLNKASPAVGASLGYFLIKLWAIPGGYVAEVDAVEASLMAGVLSTHLLMEIKVFFNWVGSFYRKEK